MDSTFLPCSHDNEWLNSLPMSSDGSHGGVYLSRLCWMAIPINLSWQYVNFNEL